MRWIVASALLVACSGGDDEQPAPVNPTVRFTEPLHTLEITATTGTVSVAAGQGSDVVVDFTPGESGDDWQNSILDGKLVMGAICGDGAIGCGASFDITMPPNTDLFVTTTTGAVELAGLGGDVEVNSDSGTILGERMSATDLITRTVDAGTNLTFSVPPTALDILGGGSGGIGITVPPGNYPLDITTLGDVILEGGVIDGDIGPELLLESGSGQVRVSGG